MTEPIFQIKAHRFLNKMIFPPTLTIYGNRVVYKIRGIIRINETSIPYTHIAQAKISSGLIFATLEIINSGGYENIIIKYVKKGAARKAKKIIGGKVFQAHSRHVSQKSKAHDNLYALEMKLNRLKELFHRGKVSKGEYRKKRRRILKKH